MNKSLQVFIAVMLFSLIHCLYAVNGIAQSESEEWERLSPHNFGDIKSCSVCHAQDSPELLADSITTCTKCHRAHVGNHPVVRHPIGKAPGRMLPVQLPVSEAEGLLVCTTCHEAHNRTSNPKMLRVSSVKLCAACHKGY